MHITQQDRASFTGLYMAEIQRNTLAWHAEMLTAKILQHCPQAPENKIRQEVKAAFFEAAGIECIKI